jgi:uncharacterized protein (DUF58 family)
LINLPNELKNIDDISELKQFENLELLANLVVEGFITGLHKSPFHGFSVEFSEHRLYNKGESVKNIDWKLYGRTDKLFVKKYEEETNLRCRIVIDTSSSMLYPYKEKQLQSKLFFSILSAASIIHLLRKQRDAVGLSFISDTVELHTQAKMSLVHSRMLYAELTQLAFGENPLNKGSRQSDLLHRLSEKIHKRSLVIIFSDMFNADDPEMLFTALQHLKHAKHDVILFHVTDNEHERNFKFQNRPYKFIDMESGETLKLNPSEIRDYYTKIADTFYEKLKLKCGQYKIDFVQADIKSDFKEVLIPFLIKRSKMN